MNRQINIPIGILLMVTILNVLGGYSFSGATSQETFEGEILINGTTTSINSGGLSLALGIDSLTGAIVWFIIIATSVCVISIQVLGSGLGETGQKTLRSAFVYCGIWGVLSGLSWGSINSIPVIGFILWILLSIIYAIGVYNKMGD